MRFQLTMTLPLLIYEANRCIAMLFLLLRFLASIINTIMSTPNSYNNNNDNVDELDKKPAARRLVMIDMPEADMDCKKYPGKYQYLRNAKINRFRQGPPSTPAPLVKKKKRKTMDDPTTNSSGKNGSRSSNVARAGGATVTKVVEKRTPNFKPFPKPFILGFVDPLMDEMIGVIKTEYLIHSPDGEEKTMPDEDVCALISSAVYRRIKDGPSEPNFSQNFKTWEEYNQKKND